VGGFCNPPTLVGLVGAWYAVHAKGLPDQDARAVVAKWLGHGRTRATVPYVPRWLG